MQRIENHAAFRVKHIEVNTSHIPCLPFAVVILSARLMGVELADWLVVAFAWISMRSINAAISNSSSHFLAYVGQLNCLGPAQSLHKFTQHPMNSLTAHKENMQTAIGEDCF